MIQVSPAPQIGDSHQSRRVPAATSIPSVADSAGRSSSVSNSECDSINSNSQVTSPLLSRKVAAKYLGVAPQTLAQWACSRRYDLLYIKVGRSVKYRKVDLDAFIESHVQINKVANDKGWAQ